ncbi:hypothetical protein [Methylomonas fluvii]|nr:hypothetical protein [Methylomonas fluvii]
MELNTDSRPMVGGYASIINPTLFITGMPFGRLKAKGI